MKLKAFALAAAILCAPLAFAKNPPATGMCRLRWLLADNGIDNDTILAFSTDN